TGSLPPGLTLPSRTSATALPAWTPGNQASRIAGDDAATFCSVSGRPLNSTTTNGLPVALIRSISCCWSPGRSSVVLDAASPLISRDSPSASTTWSAALHAATAWSNPGPAGQSAAGSYWGGSVCGREQACTNVVVPELCALIPLSRVTASWSRPVPHHGPSMAWPSSPSGPITAVFLLGSSGSVELSFFNSTIERAASLRASATASGRSCAAPALETSTYGCSNSPARNFTRRMRRTASLSRGIEIWCWASSWAPKSRISVLVLSESSPAVSAWDAASGPSAAKPCPQSPESGFTGGQARISATAAQSASTKPSKSHSPLRMSVSVSWLPQPGTPLMALNEHITVSAPAASAALTGGRERLRSRCSDSAVVLESRPPPRPPPPVLVAPVALAPARGHHRAEVRVLATTLGDPAPPRLVRDVDHR